MVNSINCDGFSLMLKVVYEYFKMLCCLNIYKFVGVLYIIIICFFIVFLCYDYIIDYFIIFSDCGQVHSGKIDFVTCCYKRYLICNKVYSDYFWYYDIDLSFVSFFSIYPVKFDLFNLDSTKPLMKKEFDKDVQVIINNYNNNNSDQAEVYAIAEAEKKPRKQLYRRRRFKNEHGEYIGEICLALENKRVEEWFGDLTPEEAKIYIKTKAQKKREFFDFYKYFPNFMIKKSHRYGISLFCMPSSITFFRLKKLILRESSRLKQQVKTRVVLLITLPETCSQESWVEDISNSFDDSCPNCICTLNYVDKRFSFGVVNRLEDLVVYACFFEKCISFPRMRYNEKVKTIFIALPGAHTLKHLPKNWSFGLNILNNGNFLNVS